MLAARFSLASRIARFLYLPPPHVIANILLMRCRLHLLATAFALPDKAPATSAARFRSIPTRASAGVGAPVTYARIPARFEGELEIEIHHVAAAADEATATSHQPRRTRPNTQAPAPHTRRIPGCCRCLRNRSGSENRPPPRDCRMPCSGFHGCWGASAQAQACSSHRQ